MSYHRSIITPNAAEIVAAINIARYEGINILSDNIITMTAIMSTVNFNRDLVIDSNCAMAKKINIAVIAKSNPSVCGI